ncbi:MAG: hypothetical protein ISS71_10205, partial [Phycisphaerae bacterium]|nr:hypothetical protein [Phycisphaerae bacterium]
MKETSIIILLCLFAISTYSNGEVYCTDPVLLTELNSTSGNAVYPHLARDGVTLYFGHRDESGTRQLYTATRDLETGVFSNITQISELASGDSLYTPWVSDDGLRLYYGEHYEAIRLYQAERNTISDPWEKKIYFSNVHQYGHNDAVPSLTSDELTMYFASARDGADDMYIWKAIRQAVNEQFVSPVKVNELVRGYRVSCPCILPDGLTIYYAEYSDNGYSDLFRATRSSLDELFSNIEPLSVNLPNQHDAF